MKLKSNIVSIPLLVITSITGLTSVAQLGADGANNVGGGVTALPVLVSIFGVSSAIISGLQKYFRYSERSEHSRHMAKAYGRVARRIENTMTLLRSEATKMKPETFQKFVEDIQKETDALFQEAEDIPNELLHKKSFYERAINSFSRKKPTIEIEAPTPKTNITDVEGRTSENTLDIAEFNTTNALQPHPNSIGHVFPNVINIPRQCVEI